MQEKISIVTAVYNGELYLSKLIESIANQKYANYEFILIDGGSTDNTINIIKNNERQIDYWISEPDKGIYDAWNKAIKIASGKWIMFLGSDDVLAEEALENYSNYLKEATVEYDYICSKLIMVDESNNHIRKKGRPWLWNEFKYINHLAHPGSLHNIALFKKYGLYNYCEYKIAGDYELLLRPGKKLKAGFLNKVTVFMREGGNSSGYKALKEHKKAMVKTGKVNAFIAQATYLLIVIKLFAKSLFRSFGLNVYISKAA